MMKSIKTSRLSILFSVAVFCTYFAIYTAVAFIYSGCGDDTALNTLVGLMDELKIYNFALTPNQVAIDTN